MTKKTHIVVGIAVTLPMLKYIPHYSAVGLIGATLPDIDILLGIRHRTVTHSLIALFLSASIILIFNKYVAIVFLINYSSHLALDSFTKMGVPLFYPWNKKYYGVKIFKTSGAEDLAICLIAFYIILQLLKYKI